MPRVARPTEPGRAINLGTEVEIRVARVWFWEGYYARRGISLQRHYQTIPLQVTDLDLIAVEFDPQLRLRRFVGESKSGASRHAPKPLDRVLWLRGLMHLLGDVTGAELTTAGQPRSDVRELGRSLGVAVQSLDDLQRRERRLRIEEVADVGSQGPGAFEARERARQAISREPELERIYWLVASDVWYASPWAALKRLVAAIQFVGHRFAPRVDDEHQFSVRWLLAELVSQAALQLVAASGTAIQLDNGEFVEHFAQQLADPGVDRRRMRQLSEAVDRYVAGMLRQAGASESAIVDSVGAFMPGPPEYAEALAETARRLTLRADVARVLPRYVDLVVHERLVRQREPTRALAARLGGLDLDFTARAARLVAVFLTGQADLPQLVASAVGEPLPAFADDVAPAAGAEDERRPKAASEAASIDPPVDASGQSGADESGSANGTGKADGGLWASAPKLSGFGGRTSPPDGPLEVADPQITPTESPETRWRAGSG